MPRVSSIMLCIICIFNVLSGCLSQVQENKEISNLSTSPTSPLKSVMIDRYENCPLTYRGSDLSYESILAQNKLCVYQ